MARIRTFIAVELDESIITRLTALQKSLAHTASDVKWVEEENLHITLLFLGEVDEREIHKVCRAVAATCANMPAFTLGVQGIGSFGKPGKPRTIWTGIGAGMEELRALHAALEEPLLELGCYRREDRRYTPHVTLGRVRSETDQALLDALKSHEAFDAGECEVLRVSVMSSQLLSEGPLYTALSRANLRQGK